MNKTVAVIGTRGYPSYYGGFETAVRKLAPYLADEGWDVTVYSRQASTLPDDPTRDPRINVVNTRGIESKSLSTLTFGFWGVLGAAQAKPDVALIMNVANCFWLPFLKARGIPTLVNVDGMEWEREKWGKVAKTIFKAGARAAALWADVLVYDAVEIGRLWKQIFKRDGLFIPYGGDEREELPVPEGLRRREYALMVARLVPENTVDDFLIAAERLAADHDVVLVGSTGYGGEFDERARELDAKLERFHWLGHVSDDDRLHALWQHAGAYFHGHTVGGTNPALVQAMACAAPIVATDTPFNNEVLAGSGEIVQISAEDIERKIRELLTDPERQEQLSAAALERSRESYSWEYVNSLYESALEDLRHVRRRRTVGTRV